ncbi:hypothetical protein [Micromonospora sp. DT31]|uniref:hypothetical protein n=1 Tax=Micromonospora sp. DT31 TaxID=3393434 RepID=UPI003CF74E42
MAHEYVENGIPFLRSQNIKRGHLDLSSVKYINEDFHQRLAKSQLRPGDLAIVRTGEPGATALIPDDLGSANCSDIVIARPGPDTVGRYLCYAINATAQQFIDAHTVGAVQQHFNVASAKRLTVAVPPIAVQEAIAGLLGALDDKIAVNDRIATTADSLIKTKYEQAVQHESRLVALLSALRLTFGAPFRSSAFNTNSVGYPLIRIRDLTTFSPQVWTEERLPRDFLVETGETVIGMDAEFRPTFWLGGAGLLNQRVMHAASLIGGGQVLAREALRAPLAHVESYKTGTTVAHLNKSDLERLEVEVPAASAMYMLEEETMPLHGMIVSLSRQNRALVEIRDTLLPELMSGRLRVREAEKVVGEAV